MPTYPTGPCHFCPTVVEGHWLVEVDRVPDGLEPLGGITCDGRWRLLVALCADHRARLVAAGAAGRVHGPSGVRWTVYVDGWPVPGYIALVDDRYAVHLGDTRALPPPSFATLEEAAQALVDFHAGR